MLHLRHKLGHHVSEMGHILMCSAGQELQSKTRGNCRKIASLTMSAVSSTFRAHYRVHSEKSAISLSWMVLPFPTVGSLVIVFQVRNSVRPMHLFGHNRDHDYYFELPLKGSGIPNQLLGDRLHTMAISGLSRVRTELVPLLIVPLLTHHPVQTNRQLAGHGDLGGFPPSPHH